MKELNYKEVLLLSSLLRSPPTWGLLIHEVSWFTLVHVNQSLQFFGCIQYFFLEKELDRPAWAVLDLTADLEEIREVETNLRTNIILRLLLLVASLQAREATVGTSLAVQQLRRCTSTAGGAGSIPGRGTKILHATWQGQKFKNSKQTLPPPQKTPLSSRKREGTASGFQGPQVCPFKYPYPTSQGLPFPFLGPDTDIRDC